jgi:hypothetical protein
MSRELLKLISIGMDGTMPKLICEGSDNAKYKLVPFRGYKMQLTGLSGSGDYGTSPVVGFARLYKQLNTPVEIPDGKHTSPYESNCDRDETFEVMIRSFCMLAISDSQYFCIYDYESINLLKEFSQKVREYVQTL